MRRLIAPATDLTPKGFAPFFRIAFAHSANAMILVDFDRKIVAANEAAAVLTGRSQAALAGMMFASLVADPGDMPDDATWHARVLAG